MKLKRIAAMIFAAVCVLTAAFVVSFNERKPNLNIETTHGVARLVSGDFGKLKAETAGEAMNVLDGLSDIYGFTDARNELKAEKVLPTAFGKVYKFSQIHNGIEVFGRGLNVAADDAGSILSISGNYLKGIDSNLAGYNFLQSDLLAASLRGAEGDAVIRTGLPRSARNDGRETTPEEAAEAVIKAYGNSCSEIPLYSCEPSIYSLSNQHSILNSQFSVHNSHILRPAYNIVCGAGLGMRIFVDMETGEILDEIPLTANETIPSVPWETTQKDYYGKNVSVTIEKTVGTNAQGQHDYVLADALRNIYILDNKRGTTLSGNYYQNNTGIFSDGAAVTAFLNLIKAFDFYSDAENIGVSLRGIDGSVSEGHDVAEENDEMCISAYMHYGNRYENAAYLSGYKESYPKTAMFIFGDGVSTGLYNPAVALDIVGHEYQHAVTEYNAGLIYRGASGAITEAYSDVFGALIEGRDMDDEFDRFWRCGEDAERSAKGAIRSMKDPAAFGYPAHYDDRVSFTGTYDDGGVHVNSNILTHLQYKMYTAFPAQFTAQNIGRLWYAALPMLPRDADFNDFRVILLQTAANLKWGETALQTMADCFDSSGINGGMWEHTITFMNGGEVISAHKYKYGETIELKAAPEIDGYIFTGWFGDEDCTFPCGDEITVREDTMIYAKYIKPVYGVSFMYGEEIIYTFEYEYGETVKLPAAPEIKDYIFADWFADEEFITPCGEEIIVRGDTRIYAKYRLKEKEETIDDPPVEPPTFCAGGKNAITAGFILTAAIMFAIRRKNI